MAPPLHKRVKRAVRSAALRAALWLLARLPLALALALGAAAGRLAWWALPRQRRLMLRHLAFAFPEKGDAERRAIARASLVHLAMVAAEVVAFPRSGVAIDAYVSFSPGSEEVVRRAMARGKGLIFVAGHIGNWELLARRLALVTQPNAVIAKRNADEKLNALVAAYRASGGNKTLWREDPSTGRELIRLFRQGGALGILIDQDTKVQGVFVPFFGELAFTPRAVGDLALRFGATVAVGTSHRRGPHRGDGHELTVVEVPYDPAAADRDAEVERLTAACAALQEAAIRGNPVEWVWMHERWKTRPPAERSQANEVPKTQELSGA
jgi:KDO2-lipid IV(A) lauroyltransferase